MYTLVYKSFWHWTYLFQQNLVCTIALGRKHKSFGNWFFITKCFLDYFPISLKISGNSLGYHSIVLILKNLNKWEETRYFLSFVKSRIVWCYLLCRVKLISDYYVFYYLMNSWLRQGFCFFMSTSRKYTSNIFVEYKMYILFDKLTILLSYVFYFILILLLLFYFLSSVPW